MEKKNIFKENWLLEDAKCEKCGAITHRQRGLTRQNLKRLITPKWDLTELLITFMMIMVIVLAYSYSSETKQCREWLKLFSGEQKDCEAVCSYQCELSQGNYVLENASRNLTFESFNLSEWD